MFSRAALIYTEAWNKRKVRGTLGVKRAKGKLDLGPIGAIRIEEPEHKQFSGPNREISRYPGAPASS